MMVILGIYVGIYTDNIRLYSLVPNKKFVYSNEDIVVKELGWLFS